MAESYLENYTRGHFNLFTAFDGGHFKAGFNHYSDECLVRAGERELGTVDFIQFHTYPWAGAGCCSSPPAASPRVTCQAAGARGTTATGTGGRALTDHPGPQTFRPRGQNVQDHDPWR